MSPAVARLGPTTSTRVRADITETLVVGCLLLQHETLFTWLSVRWAAEVSACPAIVLILGTQAAGGEISVCFSSLASYHGSCRGVGPRVTGAISWVNIGGASILSRQWFLYNWLSVFLGLRSTLRLLLGPGPGPRYACAAGIAGPAARWCAERVCRARVRGQSSA